MRKNHTATSGNIFLAIFGAVALVGVIGAGVMTFSKGPIQGALTVIRKNNASVDMSMGGQMAIMTSVNKDANADKYARVFVQSSTYFHNGNYGGLAGADTSCQTAATAAGLPGTYKAWLSDSTNSPFTRFNKLSVPYKLLNGTTIANNWADLTDGALAGAPNITETGSPWSPYPWTNTNADGVRDTDFNNHCNNWTDGTSSYNGLVGYSGATDGQWTRQACCLGCNGVSTLYCVQQEATASSTERGDCDSDGYIEPPEWRVAGGGVPKPVNGGLVPNTIGIAKKDPWGNDYGYCVWDHGPTILSANCQSTSGTNKRLQGNDSKKYPVVALISAGPDGVFTTTCRNFSTGADKADQNGDGNLEGVGDFPLVSKAAATDDDIIVSYNYDDAMATSGGLWKLKSSDLGTAYLNKKIEALGATIAGTASFDRLAAAANDFIDIVNGIKLADPTVITTCNATNTGILRRAASGYGYEQCNGSAWSSPSGGTSTNIDGFYDGISYTSNSVIGGLNAAPLASGNRITALGVSALGQVQGLGNNTALGYQTLYGVALSGGSSTGAGWKAGYGSSSVYMTAIGYEALAKGGNISNTAFGYQAAKSLGIGGSVTNNTIFGAMAMLSDSNSSANSIMGTEAGKSFTGSSVGKNTLIGYQSGIYPTTMTSNTSIGAFTFSNGSSRNDNVAIGANAMLGVAAATSADYNVAVGANTLKTISTGQRNTAIGNSAGASATSGLDCVGIGNSANSPCADGSTGIGAYSLSNATGARNTAIGHYAGNALTSGTDNTVIGRQSLQSAGTSSSYNTAAGYANLPGSAVSMRNTTAGYYSGQRTGNTDNTIIGNGTNSSAAASGINNTGFGNGALTNTTSTGNNNTAVGYGPLAQAGAAPNNTVVGYAAASFLNGVANSDNVFIGGQAGFYQNNTSSNVGVGAGAMYTYTAASGTANVAVGKDAISNADGSYNVCVGGNGACAAAGSGNVGIGSGVMTGTGVANSVAVGINTLQQATTGPKTAIGWSALKSATTSTKSTAFGTYALANNVTGTENTAFGNNALGNSTGSGNTAFGFYAMGNLTTSTGNNTGIGYYTLYALNTGGGNTGYSAASLLALTNGSNNSFFASESSQATLTNSTGTGFNITVDNGLSNATAFGRNVTASNTVGFGMPTSTSINGQVAFTATSDKRVKKDIAPTDLGLDFILRLRPVSYRLIDGNGRLDYGFIAQEVETALAGRKTNMVTRRNDDMKTYRLRADDILAPAVKAVQEQQKELEALDKELENLK